MLPPSQSPSHRDPLPSPSPLRGCDSSRYPLPLRPDKAALLGSGYHSQATPLGRSSASVVGGPHGD